MEGVAGNGWSVRGRQREEVVTEMVGAEAWGMCERRLGADWGWACQWFEMGPTSELEL